MDKETPLIKLGETLRIGTEIRKSLWKRFKLMVKKEYGQTKWFLSYEVNEALDLYMRVKSGELVVFDAVFLKDHGDYAHTNGQIYRSETFVVRKFKEKFRASKMIDYKDLKKFTIDECGYTSRTKYYDVRDELLAKNIIDYYGENKKTFEVKIR